MTDGESGETTTSTSEAYVSVDVETAGPTPSSYALLSIGACLVDDPATTFYAELRPDRTSSDAEALSVGKFSLAGLAETGEDPAAALPRFAAWVDQVVPAGTRPVFLGFNAAFDWMFVADYLQRYAGSNPFGHAALDVKAYAMGRLDSSWAATSLRHLAPRLLGPDRALPHHALADAQLQAELFRALRALPAADPPG